MNSQTSSLQINTSYVVDQVPGSLRVSPIPYTHAVIGHRDGILSAAGMDTDFAASRVETEKTERTYWENQKMLSLSPIVTLFINDDGRTIELTHNGILAAKAYLLGMPTADSAIEILQRIQANTVRLEREIGLGPISVIQWYTSEENAKMAVNAFTDDYSEVQVVQCSISRQ